MNRVGKLILKPNRHVDQLTRLAGTRKNLFILISTFVPNKDKSELFRASKKFHKIFGQAKKQIFQVLKNCPDGELQNLDLRQTVKFAENREQVLGEFYKSNAKSPEFCFSVENEEIVLIHSDRHKNAIGKKYFGEKLFVGIVIENKIQRKMFFIDLGKCKKGASQFNYSMIGEQLGELEWCEGHKEVCHGWCDRRTVCHGTEFIQKCCRLTSVSGVEYYPEGPAILCDVCFNFQLTFTPDGLQYPAVRKSWYFQVTEEIFQEHAEKYFSSDTQCQKIYVYRDDFIAKK